MNIRLFEVGGSIRDVLMGIDHSDRDFCAVSPNGWDELVLWCNQNMKKVFLTNPQFFTIRGIIGKDAVDIVMCRKDGEYSDGRRPDSVQSGTIHDDLARRDFTCNAMAREVCNKTLKPLIDEIDKSLIDPFGGRKDLEDNILRCVGNTDIRLKEDGLRVMRAFRFMITKNLLPDRSLEKAMMDEDWWSFMIDTVSEERVREEMHKMFKFDTPRAMFILCTSLSPSSLRLLFDNIWLKPTLEKRR